jgi:hypothetical protein
MTNFRSFVWQRSMRLRFFLVSSLLLISASVSAQSPDHKVRNVVLVRCLGRWFGVEGRLRHPDERWIQRQHRAGTRDLV